MKIPVVNSRKKAIIVVVVILLIGAGGSTWYWLTYSRSKSTSKDLREAATKQEKMRLSDSEVNRQNQLDKALTEVDTLNRQQKFAEAKTKIDKLAKDNATASEATRDTIFGLYAVSCSGLVDISCMNDTLKHFESKDTAYFIYAVMFAESAKAANKTVDARAYYQFALAVVDKNGGQKFIDNLNKVSKERQYDIATIKAGAS